MSELQSSAIADTDGWDIVFAIRYDDVNRSIARAFADRLKYPDLPRSFRQVVRAGRSDAVLEGEFGPWELTTGGSGQDLKMLLPIKTGTLSYNDKVTPLDNHIATIGVKAKFLPQPDATADRGNNILVLKTDDGASNTVETILIEVPPSSGATPADGQSGSTLEVQGLRSEVVDLVDLQPRIDDLVTRSLAKQSLENWLNEHLQEFNFVFATVDLAEEIAEAGGQFQWLSPTSTAYGVSELGVDPTVDNSVFGIMTMTENRTNLKTSNNVSPYAIPEGSRAGFLISRDRFVNKFILPDIASLFAVGTTPDDFTVQDNGAEITNNKDLDFQEMQLDSGQNVTPSIKAQNFILEIQDTSIYTKLSRTKYTYSPGIDVFATFESWASVELASEGYINLQAYKTQASGDVEMSTAVRIAELAGGLIASVLGGAVGTSVGKYFSSDAEVVEQSAERATIPMVEITASEAGERAGADVVEQVGREEAAAASIEVQATVAAQPAATQRMSGWIVRNWLKLMFGIIGTGTGASIGAIPEMLKNRAENKLDKLPKFQKFASTAVKPIVWSDGRDLILKSAQLNGSLQLGGDVTFEQTESHVDQE